MFYMLEVFLIVSIPVVAVAGAVLLTLIAWTQVKDFCVGR